MYWSSEIAVDLSLRKFIEFSNSAKLLMPEERITGFLVALTRSVTNKLSMSPDPTFIVVCQFDPTNRLRLLRMVWRGS